MRNSRKIEECSRREINRGRKKGKWKKRGNRTCTWEIPSSLPQGYEIRGPVVFAATGSQWNTWQREGEWHGRKCQSSESLGDTRQKGNYENLCWWECICANKREIIYFLVVSVDKQLMGVSMGMCTCVDPAGKLFVCLPENSPPPLGPGWNVTVLQVLSSSTWLRLTQRRHHCFCCITLISCAHSQHPWYWSVTVGPDKEDHS